VRDSDVCQALLKRAAPVSRVEQVTAQLNAMHAAHQMAVSAGVKVDVHGQGELSDADMQLVLARAAAQRRFVVEMTALRTSRRLASLALHAPYLSEHELSTALAHCDDDDDDCALRLARESFVRCVRELCAQRAVEKTDGALPRRNLRTRLRALYVRGAFVPAPLPTLVAKPDNAGAPGVSGRLHAPVDANGKPRQKGFFIESEAQNSTTIEAALAAAAAKRADPATSRKRQRSSSGSDDANAPTAADAKDDAPPVDSVVDDDVVDDDDGDGAMAAIVVDTESNRALGGAAASAARESGRLNLDDAVRRAQAGSFDGWSEARKKAFKSMNENPNAYYYRFNAPGEEQKNGHWAPDEEKLFFDVAKIYPVNTKWGLFSMHIPGRVGYQCSNFYRQLVRTGRIKDPNYILDANGRPRFLFKNKKGDAEVRNYKQPKAADAAAVASTADDSAANSSTSEAPMPATGGEVISRARKNKLPKPPKEKKEPRPPPPPLFDADGNPIPRKRGRPRKYPVAPTATTTTATATPLVAPLHLLSLPPPPPPPPLPLPLLAPFLFAVPSDVPPPPPPPPAFSQAVVPQPILKPARAVADVAPVEPVFLTAEKKDADVSVVDPDAAAADDVANASTASTSKPKKQRAAAAPAKPKKKARKGSRDVIWADEVDDTRDEVPAFHVSKRLRGALGVENPMPDYVDPITRLPVVAPMMSPAGIVLGKETWIYCLARKQECPLTKQPVKLDTLTLLTPQNFDRLKDKLKLL
jgi:hypothetical protein